MPHLLISSQVRLESGPTLIGDCLLDKPLVQFLEAELVEGLGNNFSHYVSPHPPRIILNKLETKGYKVVSSCGVGQTCVWTLYAENPEI